MLTIPIDLWLVYARKMNDAAHRVRELSVDCGEEVEELDVYLKMWKMILCDMEVVQAGKKVGAQFEVI